MRRSLVIIGMGCALTGCVSASPPIVGLYKSAQCQVDDKAPTDCLAEPDGAVSVVSNAPAANADSPPGSQFAERAEAAYIKALADPRYTKDAASLRAALAANLKSESGSARDRRQITRVLTVTTRKSGAFNPDDRLELTDVELKLPAGAHFVSWDNATSIYNTINGGSLQVTSARGVETDLGLAAPTGAPITASLGEKITSSTGSTQNLSPTYQVESLTVSVEGAKDVLRIRRQGGPGVDLTGNVAIKVVIDLGGADEISTFKASSDLFKDDKPANPGSLVLDRTVTEVGPASEVTGTVAMTYVIRHVKTGGGAAAAAAQDIVEHTRHTAPINISYADLVEAYPASFGLFDRGSLRVARELSVLAPGLDPQPLCFASPTDATSFLRYLRVAKGPSKVGASEIGWYTLSSAAPLNVSDVVRLEVRSGCGRPGLH